MERAPTHPASRVFNAAGRLGDARTSQSSAALRERCERSCALPSALTSFASSAAARLISANCATIVHGNCQRSLSARCVL